MEWQDKDSNVNKGKNFHNDRQKTTAALISNCNDRSGRLEYIKQLSTQVDIFGKCGIPCPDKYKNVTAGACRDIIFSEYKFFLAFENSGCKEYITEKFFLSLSYDIVPVVLGEGNYEIYVPKSGFIQTKDFSDVKQLADRLNYLNSNATAYNEHFKWKEYVRFRPEIPNIFYSMCVHLHFESHLEITKGVIDNLGAYSSTAACKF